MQFQLLPILSTIEDFYKQPISQARFEQYLQKMQGDIKGDVALPIMGFNPMAKEVVAQKIAELKKLDAEGLVTLAIKKINTELATQQDNRTIKIALTLADDIGGAWTNHYTTDFASKFEIKALLKRDFCTPHFWVSENYTCKNITERSLAYAYRTLYQIENPDLRSLEDYLAQEIFVCQNIGMSPIEIPVHDAKVLERFYENFRKEEDYNICFNFFYGDAACKSLAYPSFGLQDFTGFDYAKMLATTQKVSKE